MGPASVKRIVSIVLSGISLLACAGAPVKVEEQRINNDAVPELPDEVYFKTSTESFNERYFFMLVNNALYVKRREDLDGSPSAWNRIDKYQMSASSKEEDKILALQIDQINVDGKKVQIIYDDKIYSCNTGLADYSDWIWDCNWGFPFSFGPGIALPQKYRGWSVSSSDPDTQKYQTDQNGNKFSVFVGSIYILSEDGTLIYLADPWTPADWGYRIATPMRGRFIARNISASGSVVFLLNDYGDMFTKHVDFDVIGANPTLRYTYETIPVHEGIFHREHPRKLPIADWKRQPRIDGKISDKITIYTTGEGEDARSLRVEGWDAEGNTGFFEKSLTAGEWNFVKVSLLDNAEPLSHNSSQGAESPVLGAKKDLRYTGRIGDHLAVLDDFNLYSSPSSLRIELKSGAVLQLYLHTVFTFRTRIQRNPGTRGSPLDLKGVVEIPETLAASSDSETKAFLKRYLRYPSKTRLSRFIPISAEATKSGIRLERDGLLGFLSRWKIDFSSIKP